MTANIQTQEEKPAQPDAALLDDKGVAALVHCSTRHIHRLKDVGKMPAPVPKGRLGSLLRWNRAEIESWIAQGCPPARTVRRGAR